MEHLTSEESWNKFIKSVETNFDELETNSERIKRQLKQILTDKEIIENIKKVIEIIKDNDYTKVSVGLVVYSAVKFAKENNEKILLTGLGSEEIFAGYQRHLKNSLEEVHKECFRGLRQDIWKRDITRDKLIADHFKVKLISPFLDKEIIKIEMKLHPMI